MTTLTPFHVASLGGARMWLLYAEGQDGARYIHATVEDATVQALRLAEMLGVRVHILEALASVGPGDPRPWPAEGTLPHGGFLDADGAGGYVLSPVHETARPEVGVDDPRLQEIEFEEGE